MTKRAKPIIKILFVNIALVGIGILIIEFSFGHWFSSNNLNRLNIPTNRSFTYDVGKFYESPINEITYTRDEFGLRGQFKNPSEIYVLTVGGSTTDQKLITDGQTWQDILQQQFKAFGKLVRVANAGVDGQSTYGHIKNYDWWFPYIPDLKPKYVLYYIGLNDFYKDEGYAHDLLEYNSLREILSDKSAIYALLRTLKGIYLAKIKKLDHRAIDFQKLDYVSEPLQTSYDALMNARLSEYSERLEILIQKTKSLGSTPIFVTQPSRKYRFNKNRVEGVNETFKYDDALINGVDFYYMLRKLDFVTCSKAQEHNILCIDMAKEMLTKWDDDDFYDFSHMTPKGAKKVGQYLFNTLRDQL